MTAHTSSSFPSLLELPLAARYGIEAAVALSEGAPNQFHRVRDVADRLRLPREFLAKIFGRLAQAGLVEARRGPGGGYRLADAPSRIPLLDVAEAASASSPAPRPCLLFPRACGDVICSAHDVVVQAEHVLREALAKLTLASLRDETRTGPESPKRQSPAPALAPMILFAFLGAGACKGGDIDVYRAPKEAAQAEESHQGHSHEGHTHPPAATAAVALPPAAAVPAADAGAPKGEGSGPGLTWKAPAGWASKPVSGMRFATFGVPTKSGEAELSVIVLAGEAGGNLANVNRWRGQLGLGPIDEATLNKEATAAKSAAGTLLVVEMAGADKKLGLIAAILPQATQTWFFKLTGSSEAISAAKAPLLKFLGTLR